MKRRISSIPATLIVLLLVLMIPGCGSESTSPADPGGDDDPTGPFTWYVDVDAMDGGNGKSWETAFTHPSTAMNAASAGDQIWIADGTYGAPGSRNEPVVAFKAGVELYGGFAGDETDRSQMDHGNRAIFDGGDTLYHVVTGADDALLYGIIVRGGRGTGTSAESEVKGGGIYCYNAKMRIAQCNITYNEAYLGAGIYVEGATVVIDSCIINANHAHQGDADEAGGGGIAVVAGGVEITSCSITGNTSGNNGGGLLLHDSSSDVSGSTIAANNVADTAHKGGGIYVSNETAPGLRVTFTDCAINQNRAVWGGGIATNVADVAISDCYFDKNNASTAGSALYLTYSSYVMEHCILTNNGASTLFTQYQLGPAPPRVFNCIFAGNGDSDLLGGAIFNNAVSPVIMFCTITGNRARQGAGIYNAFPVSSPTVTNSIVWDNYSTTGPPQIQNSDGATTTVTYTDIDQDGFAGVGLHNLRSNPRFTSVGMTGIYYLSDTGAGQDSDSPCIDMGDDTAESHGLDSWTTRTDNVSDTGLVDLGFHHRVPD